MADEEEADAGSYAPHKPLLEQWLAAVYPSEHCEDKLRCLIAGEMMWGELRGLDEQHDGPCCRASEITGMLSRRAPELWSRWRADVTVVNQGGGPHIDEATALEEMLLLTETGESCWDVTWMSASERVVMLLAFELSKLGHQLLCQALDAVLPPQRDVGTFVHHAVASALLTHARERFESNGIVPPHGPLVIPIALAGRQVRIAWRTQTWFPNDAEPYTSLLRCLEADDDLLHLVCLSDRSGAAPNAVSLDVDRLRARAAGAAPGAAAAAVDGALDPAAMQAAAMAAAAAAVATATRLSEGGINGGGAAAAGAAPALPAAAESAATAATAGAAPSLKVIDMLTAVKAIFPPEAAPEAWLCHEVARLAIRDAFSRHFVPSMDNFWVPLQRAATWVEGAWQNQKLYDPSQPPSSPLHDVLDGDACFLLSYCARPLPRPSRDGAPDAAAPDGDEAWWVRLNVDTLLDAWRSRTSDGGTDGQTDAVDDRTDSEVAALGVAAAEMAAAAVAALPLPRRQSHSGGGTGRDTTVMSAGPVHAPPAPAGTTQSGAVDVVDPGSLVASNARAAAFGSSGGGAGVMLQPDVAAAGSSARITVRPGSHHQADPSQADRLSFSPWIAGPRAQQPTSPPAVAGAPHQFSPTAASRPVERPGATHREAISAAGREAPAAQQQQPRAAAQQPLQLPPPRPAGAGPSNVLPIVAYVNSVGQHYDIMLSHLTVCSELAVRFVMCPSAVGAASRLPSSELCSIHILAHEAVVEEDKDRWPAILYLVDVSSPLGTSSWTMVEGLKGIFESSRTVKITHHAAPALSLLKTQHRMSPANFLDTQTLNAVACIADRAQPAAAGAAAVAPEHMRGMEMAELDHLLAAAGMPLPSTVAAMQAAVQCDPGLWRLRPISPELAQYAALQVQHQAALARYVLTSLRASQVAAWLAQMHERIGAWAVALVDV